MSKRRAPIRVGTQVRLRHGEMHMSVESIDTSDMTALCTWNDGYDAEWFKLNTLISVDRLPSDDDEDDL